MESKKYAVDIENADLLSDDIAFYEVIYQHDNNIVLKYGNQIGVFDVNDVFIVTPEDRRAYYNRYARKLLEEHPELAVALIVEKLYSNQDIFECLDTFNY